MLDSDQKELLRALLLREQELVRRSMGRGITLYGDWAVEIPARAELIARTLTDLED